MTDLRTVLLRRRRFSRRCLASAQAALPPAPAQRFPVTPGPDVRVKSPTNTRPWSRAILFLGVALVNIYNRRSPSPSLRRRCARVRRFPHRSTDWAC